MLIDIEKGVGRLNLGEAAQNGVQIILMLTGQTLETLSDRSLGLVHQRASTPRRFLPRARLR